MNIKKIILLFLILMLLLSTTSCSNGNTEEQEGSGQLSIYIMDYDTNTKDAIAKFNETHKVTSIKETTFLTTDQDSMRSKLTFELTRGQGPDIILCDANTLPNLSVYFDKGSFCDLNELINNNKSFKLSEYFEKVLDFGVYKGKRYVIPLSFDIDAMFTTKHTLDKNKIEINSEEVTINKLSNAVQAYMQDSKSTDRYFYSGLNFNTIMQTTKIPFIDLENKKASFDSIEFINLLKQYKDLLVSVYDKDNSGQKAYNIFDTKGLLPLDKIAVLNTPVMQPRYITEAYAGFKSEVEPEIYPLVSADDVSHVIAKPEMIIGINSKCKNKKAALDFVKLLLSKEYQDTEFMLSIPVNRQAYAQEKDSCIKGKKGYDSWSKGGIRTEATLKKLFTQLDKLIDNIDRCEVTDSYILTLVQNELQKYLKNNCTVEDAAKNIQEKAANYCKSGFVSDTGNLKEENAKPTDPMKTLSIYYWDIPNYVGNSEEIFSENYPDIKLDKKIFKSISDFYTSIAVEVMAGGGPDIIIFQPRHFNSINKVVKTGVFCEMDEFIEKNNILNFSEYNKKLLDDGVYNEKRYYIPLYYFYTPFVTTKEILADNDIKIDEADWTWQKLAEYSTKYMEKNKGKNKYFLDINFSIKRMLFSCEVPLIDYMNKKSNFNSDAFREILRIYRDLYPAVDKQGDGIVNLLQSRRCVLTSGQGVSGAGDFDYYNTEIANRIGEDMEVIPVPSLKGTKNNIYVVPADCIAVNSRCKNKEAAFNFIKIAVSYEMQRDYNDHGKVNNFSRAPVNEKAYKADMNDYMNALAGALPKMLGEKMVGIHERLESLPIKDYKIYDIASEAAQEYVDGRKTEDQVVKEIDDKVNIFLNE